jgi:hypothetical protein
VVLVGPSDLDFIVEHACRRSGLQFIKAAADENVPGTDRVLTVYSENIEENTEGPPANTVYLSRLVMRQAAAAAR